MFIPNLIYKIHPQNIKLTKRTGGRNNECSQRQSESSDDVNNQDGEFPFISEHGFIPPRSLSFHKHVSKLNAICNQQSQRKVVILLQGWESTGQLLWSPTSQVHPPLPPFQS